MKAVILKVPTGSKLTAGQRVDFKEAELDVLQANGHEYEPAGEYDLRQERIKARETSVDALRDALVKCGSLKPKDDEAWNTLRVEAMEMEEGKAGTGVKYLSGMVRAAGGEERGLNKRITSGGEKTSDIRMGHVTASEAAGGYVDSMALSGKAMRLGDFKGAAEESRKSGSMLKELMAAGGEDMRIADVINGCTPGDVNRIVKAMDNAVKAADYTDPNSQLGTLNTGLVLMRNLGFLKNKLSFLPYITTDLRNEPAEFGQTIWTRYIVPPNVLTWVPGVGFTSDATTINANTNTSTIGNAGTQTVQSGVATAASGTLTLSNENTTDRNVLLGKFKAVEITFPVTTLAATVRNLFAEQRGAQTYALANAIAQDFLVSTFQSTWNGTVPTFSLGAFGLPQMVSLKNRLTLGLVPDVGRFAVMHSFYHDSLLTDTNLLTAKAILALINKDASAFEQGDVPSLFGVKPIETQLASYVVSNLNAAQPTPVATAQAPTISGNGSVTFGNGINAVGFAGNMSSMIFVARVPQDFTKVQTALGIPPTASVELVTEPDMGLTMMVFKFVNNATMAINCRVCIMWGFGQGHPGIGIVLTP